MKILIDIGHPAHIHLFKNFIKIMEKKGHKIIVTTKEEKIIKYLLNTYKIKFINLGKKGNTIKDKFLKQITFDIKVLYYLYLYNIDIAIGTSISIANACLFHKSKSIVFNQDDSKSAPLFAKFAYPFANYIITPDSINEDYGKKHIKLKTLKELAYLHPNNFKPNPKPLNKFGLKLRETYFVLRFTAFKAHHDIGKRGLSIEMKRKLVALLNKYGKVIISSESEIEDEFKQYQVISKPELIHDLLYYSTMFMGDSQTMTIEAAVLGIPTIRCNDFVGKCPVIEDLEKKYGLTYGFKPKDTNKMLKKIRELLKDKKIKDKWEKKRSILLKDKIDLTKWMVDFIENEK